MTLSGLDVKDTAKQFAREFRDDDVSGLAAELAYRFFVALFPFLIFLAALGGFLADAADVSNPADRVVDALDDTLPPDAASLLRRQADEVIEGSNAGLISIGIIGAIWAASSGVGTLMKAINRAYNVPESRSFLRKAAISLTVTIVGGLGLLIGFSLLIVTQIFASDVAAWLGLSGEYELTVDILRFPVLLLVVLATIAFVYWLAPNTGVAFRWVSPGAMLFTVAWAVFTVGFAIYVSNFSNYNATYGALGGVVVLLLWLYVTSLLMVAGAVLNSVIDEQRSPDTMRDRRDTVARELEARRHPTARRSPGEPTDPTAPPQTLGPATRDRR